MAWPLLLGMLLGACGAEPDLLLEPPCAELRWSGEAMPFNLVLIVNDAMRRDRVGIYGGAAHTPNFDALAAEGVWFESAITQSPWTKPSIATLFTSLFPSQHGVLSDPQARDPYSETGAAPVEMQDVVSEKVVTLAEVFRAAGYRTAAIVSNPWLDARFGFQQGFDSYDDTFARFDLPGTAVTEKALHWLADLEEDEKFFLYLHYLDSHRPYPELTLTEIAARAEEIDRDRRELSEPARRVVSGLVRLEGGVATVSAGVPLSLTLLDMAYNKGVADFDRALGRFLEALDRHPARDRTAVIVTSDHGEALFDRGYGGHGRGLFDDEVAIPLAARLPGVTAERARVGCMIGLIDLMPTLCTYLGLDCPEPIFGTSLLRAADPSDARSSRYLVTEGVGKRPEHRAIRTRRYKLMWEPGPGPDGEKKENPYSLYDLERDPGEQRDLLHPERATSRSRRIFDRLSSALPRAVPAYATPEREYVPVDPEISSRLRALGYLDD